MAVALRHDDLFESMDAFRELAVAAFEATAQRIVRMASYEVHRSGATLTQPRPLSGTSWPRDVRSDDEVEGPDEIESTRMGKSPDAVSRP